MINQVGSGLLKPSVQVSIDLTEKDLLSEGNKVFSCLLADR